MQVRKFEARTMKDALEMVKHELGPDAVILAAKDNSKRFGISGGTSVEVTAAVSEGTLRKKQFAEQKLNQRDREVFSRSPVRSQRDFIDRVVNKHVSEQPRQVTQMRYADILEDEQRQLQQRELQDRQVRPEPSGHYGQMGRKIPRVNIEEVVELQRQAAWNAVQAKAQSRPAQLAEVSKAAPQIENSSEDAEQMALQAKNKAQSEELSALKQEIAGLKELISEFKKMPQSFVALHPGANEGIPYDLSAVYEDLRNTGINRQNTLNIMNAVQENLPKEQWKKPSLVKAWVAKYLMERIQVVNDPYQGKYHVFVGPESQGKTTSLIKMASHLVLKEKKRVAIVSLDTKKAGAKEQLKTFAQILNVPFAVVRRRDHWATLDQKLAGVDVILIDAPGLALKTTSELDTLKQLLPPVEYGRRIHYTQSVLSRDDQAFEAARRYQSLGFHDVIITNLDESVQHGLIYNFQSEFGVPLHSFGVGSRIPEDFEPASKERVIDLLFRLTQVRKEKLG